MAESTGIRSATSSRRHNSVLRTPLPAPASKPVGPLRLSTHPGIGSFHDAVTVKEKLVVIKVQRLFRNGFIVKYKYQILSKQFHCCCKFLLSGTISITMSLLKLN